MNSNPEKNSLRKNGSLQVSGQSARRPTPNFLRSWTLCNFKSVRNATVDFAALTVLVGPNSAGKSSLLQSILLFAQNAQRNGRVLDMAARGQMFFNGDLVELGSIDETLNKTAHENKQNLSFGGDFYLGKEAFRPRFGGSRRTQGERIVWKVDFAVDKKNPLSGLALVKQSEVYLCSANERVGEVIATSADGSQIQVSSFPDDPRFSYEHEALVKDSSDGNPYEYNAEEKYSAVSFASGLPYEGLVQKPKLEILLGSILSEIRDFARGSDSLGEAILDAKLNAEKTSSVDGGLR
jgi:energy-coupling factor transporter ATP-binding protein EcfA2